MDGASLQDKLLANLHTAFTKDPDIDEYDILPVTEPVNNANPIVLVDQKLGIELWAAKILFTHAYKKVLSLATSKKSKQKIGQNAAETILLTKAVLLMNADCMTAWNIRKCLIIGKSLSLEEDLKFGALVLGKHPKSPETFSQRKWVMTQLKQQVEEERSKDEEQGNTSSAALGWKRRLSNALNQEVHVAELAAGRYTNNYNAWNYRMWLLDICSCDLDFILAELKATEGWVSSHISDHSGFHYRQNLLNRLNSRLHMDYPSLLKKEFHLTSDFITRYPEHEAIWYHRRFLVHRLHMLTTEQDQVAHKRCKLEKDDETNIIDQEKNFCKNSKEQRPSPWQLTLIERHEVWLQRTIL